MHSFHTNEIENSGETGLTALLHTETEGASFLIFRLGGTLFAVPALAVREIHALPQLLPLPETSPFVLGMFNLRGIIVPVVDLSARFGHESPPLTLDDTLIVLDFNGALVALLAQEVRTVSRIASAQIEPPPAHGRQSDLATPLVVGVTQIEEHIVLLLHLTHLLDFTLATENLSLSPARYAPRFEAMEWTPAEQNVLQERAARLRPTSIGSNGEHDQGFDIEAASGEKRAPVAIFTLGGEEFATPLDMVREFASLSSVAVVPCCPPHVLGQINLRGDIVTLLDIRQTLRTARLEPPFFETGGMAGAGAKSSSLVSVVVVQHDGGGVGIAVDEVRDVLYLRPDEWTALDPRQESSGAHGSVVEHPYFAGGAVYEGRLLPLLDFERLLAQGGLEVDETA
jgi:purine-binding chemotaxis protein CheW